MLGAIAIALFGVGLVLGLAVGRLRAVVVVVPLAVLIGAFSELERDLTLWLAFVASCVLAGGVVVRRLAR